jgi:hypothetical protein
MGGRDPKPDDRLFHGCGVAGINSTNGANLRNLWNLKVQFRFPNNRKQRSSRDSVRGEP